MIQLEGVCKSVKEKRILKDINLSIGSGLTCIVGDSGAGKSTLLNLIGKLDECTSGKIRIKIQGKESIFQDEEEYRRKYIGFVFQEANLIPGLTVLENLQVAGEITGKENIKKCITEVVENLGLMHIADEKAECISGGEKIRVAIARAILKDAPIILADEPTGSLDSRNSIQIFKILKQISKERTVVVVTHNLELASEYADRVITLCDGQVCADTGSGLEEGEGSGDGVSFQEKKEKSISAILKRKLLINNITRYKGKFMAVTLTIAVAMVAMSIIFSIGRGVSIKSEELNSLYYNADMISVFPYDFQEKSTTSIVMGESLGVIKEDNVAELEGSGLFSEVLPVYDFSLFINDNGTVSTIPYRFIELNDFFRNRIAAGHFSGSFPNESNQMIIGRDLEDALFDGDSIGKKLLLRNEYGDEYRYLIVGVNGEKDVDGKYINYIPVESIGAQSNSDMMAFLYAADKVEDFSKDVYSEDASGNLSSIFDETIIFGEMPTHENQIAISCEVARELAYNVLGKKIDISTQRLGDEKAVDALNELIHQRYYIGANDAYSCEITGVYEGLSQSILTTPEWYSTITVHIPNYAECYCKNMETVYSFKDTDIARRYSYSSNYEERFENAVASTSMWRNLFAISFVLLVVICILLLHSYAKVAIYGRLYESGVLRSLGMNLKMIRRLVMMEIMLPGLVASVLASMAFLVWVSLSKVALGFSFEKTLVFYVPLVLVAGGQVICWALSILETRKLGKVSVVESIRMRE